MVHDPAPGQDRPPPAQVSGFGRLAPHPGSVLRGMDHPEVAPSVSDRRPSDPDGGG